MRLQAKLGHIGANGVVGQNHPIMYAKEVRSSHRAQRFDDGLPETSLKDLDTKVFKYIVGKMSAISEILPLDGVLG